MRLRKAVGPGRVIGRALFAVVGDHLLAAAGIAGEGGTGKRRFRGEQPFLISGATRAIKPLACSRARPRAWKRGMGVQRLPAQFRQAIGPARGGAVGGGGVQHHGALVFHHGNSFARRRVRQTEDGRVAGVERPLAPGYILALLLRQFDQFHIPARGQPLADAQPRRTRAAVDEHPEQRSHPHNIIL